MIYYLKAFGVTVGIVGAVATVVALEIVFIVKCGIVRFGITVIIGLIAWSTYCGGQYFKNRALKRLAEGRSD
jgi:hypothetical protein